MFVVEVGGDIMWISYGVENSLINTLFLFAFFSKVKKKDGWMDGWNIPHSVRYSYRMDYTQYSKQQGG